MSLDVCRVGEGLVTAGKLAAEGLVAGVDADVAFERRRLEEALGAAGVGARVGLVARVLLQVALEREARVQRLGADGADEIATLPRKMRAVAGEDARA